MLTRPAALAVAAAALSLGALTACGGSPDAAPAAGSATVSTPAAPAPSTGGAATESAAAPSPTAEPVVITIKDFEYSLPASVAPGATVTVVNQDSQNHTVTVKGTKTFDVTATARGGKATFTAPTQPGRYPFICTFHGGMSSVLVVR